MEGNTLTRRGLVLGCIACSGALLAGASGVSPQIAHAENGTDDRGKGGDPNSQYGFLMNVQRCVNCGECVKACRTVHGTPDDKPARRKIVTYQDRTGQNRTVSYSCMQCEKPACLAVCPAGAISKGDGGIVLVDKNRCIGCKYCYQACPFEAPHYDSVSMYKCDCCLDVGVELGELTYCVRACKTQALQYGKLDDLLALSDRVVRIGGPTEPSAALV